MWVVDKVKRFVFVFAMYTGLSMASRGEFMVFFPLLIFIFFYLPASMAMQTFNLCVALAHSIVGDPAAIQSDVDIASASAVAAGSS